MSIRQKSEITIVACEQAQKRMEDEPVNRHDIPVEPFGDDWKALKERLSYARVSTEEEDYFIDQYNNELRRFFTA